MKTKKILSTLTAATIAAAGSASAVIIADDDFSAEGSGTGWAASTDWGAGNVSGGEYSDTGTNFRNFASTTSSADGTEIWVTFDVSIASNSWGGLSFYNGSNEVLMFGRDTGHQFWGIDGAFVSDTYTTIPWVADETVQLVGRLQFAPNLPSTTDQVSLWVNPLDMSSLAALGTPDATTPDNNLGPYTRVRLGTGSTGLTVDSLIIGTTLADLTVVPEPSSAALLGLGGIALILRRRK